MQDSSEKCLLVTLYQNETGNVWENKVWFIIACHLLRNFLNAYEITVIQRNEQCKAAGKHTFTRWSMICSQFSNLLLVFNSSTNMILYCIMNKHFRTDFLLIVKTMILCLTCRTVKCRDSGETSQQNSQQHDNVNVIPETAETNVWRLNLTKVFH